MTSIPGIRALPRWTLFAVLLLAFAAWLLHHQADVAGGATACVPARAHASGDFSETIVSNSVTRSYELHVPPSYTGGDAVPLVLNWHGLGSSAPVQQIYSGLPAKSDAEGFIVVAPQGLGNPASHNFATIAAEPDDMLFTNDLLDELESQLCIDSDRIYSTGMSNGAQMSTRLACNVSDRIAAVAPVAGWYYPPFSPQFPIEPGCFSTRPVPIIAFHGTADPTIPYEGGPGIFDIPFRSFEDEIMPEWAAHHGCDPTPVEQQVTQNVHLFHHESCEDDVTVELYVVEDGGHVWPGAPGATQEISATDLMWDFFLANPLGSEGGVGGLSQFSDGTFGPAATSGHNVALIAALSTAGATAGLVAVGGAAWYARRRWR